MTGGRHRHTRPSRRPWLAIVAGAAAVFLLVAGSLLAVTGGFLVGRGGPSRRPVPVVPPADTGEQAETATTGPGRVVANEIGPSGVTSGRVKTENAKPGSSGWRIQNLAMHGEIEGYTDAVSVESGQPVKLYVSTVAPTYQVEAYRMGFYQGLGGRLVWQSTVLPGVRQAQPTISAKTNMVAAGWLPSITMVTDGWPEGDYLFKLIAGTGPNQWVPLTIRNDLSTAAYVVINAVTTWQAYNLWGGYDLYSGVSSHGADYGHRARVVSFDRPYALGGGAGDFLGNEYPLVSLVESLGLDVTYTTSVDVDQRPGRLQQHRAVLSPGHDEYYSGVMRQAMMDARAMGVNLAFMGANAMFRHIRFAPSPLGPDRQEICYKSAAEDPLTGNDTADVTVNWRDPPTNLPESEIIGQLYQCNPVKADMVVTDASNWLFEGTGLRNGDRLADVVGPEYDRYDSTLAHPPDVEVLTRSPLTCGGSSDWSTSTYYSTPGGAGVFASGTIAWIADLGTPCGSHTPCASTALVHITQNLLAAFGPGPAGLTHRSVTAPTVPTTVHSSPPTTARRGGGRVSVRH